MDEVRSLQLKHFDAMYTHTMTIMREISTTNADHSTSLALKIVEENIPCHMSAKEIDRPEATDTVNPVSVVYKMFCAPDVDILSGDRIKINGMVYVAGESIIYPAHRETLLARKDLSCQVDATTEN